MPGIDQANIVIWPKSSRNSRCLGITWNAKVRTGTFCNRMKSCLMWGPLLWWRCRTLIVDCLTQRTFTRWSRIAKLCVSARHERWNHQTAFRVQLRVKQKPTKWGEGKCEFLFLSCKLLHIGICVLEMRSLSSPCLTVKESGSMQILRVAFHGTPRISRHLL